MTDPLKSLDSGRLKPTAVSRQVHAIAGISVTVFGLEELNAQASEVACLWLLHPRLATQERMTDIAASTINDWNSKNQDTPTAKGLIAVSFDQRNHGARMADPLANEAWRQGNPRHAQDMFSIFRRFLPWTGPAFYRIIANEIYTNTEGTARDTSLLMDYLAAFVFPNGEHKITENLVLGVSLGGHAAWSCLFHEPRISAGVVIIGCPDYLNLMVDRARLSKLPSWTKSNPPGSEILGSEALPASFVDVVNKYDPAGLLLSQVKSAPGPLRDGTIPQPTDQEQQELRPLLSRCLAGKRILNLSGGIDKLVPYHRGESFLQWFKGAISPNGWFGDGAITFEDIIDESAGHEVTPKMADEAVRFISETLAIRGDNGERKGSVRESKI
ncbi:uncharacterized protein N7483_007815 [Penicillium malachiteum]|uniref:uncharacterized protein n=1 Tax=Penicillium malachiteum TaxID=1324776 RepID=UPI00254816A6|nr:uncharacterized protein N7483_007815 [Penicillium malachiteum]KAJ5726458.1 hypothetical protein N7483_007815 [Penicillium malachiteum]